MTHAHVSANALNSAQLPVVLDIPALEAHFGIGRTTAYLLATAGHIQSLTLGAPGKKGKRVFLTESVLAYVERRLEESKPLNCIPREKAKRLAA